MIVNIICYLSYVLVLMCSNPSYLTDAYHNMEVHLTISAETRSLEVSWENARLWSGDVIMITKVQPIEFRKISDLVVEKKNIFDTILEGTKKISNKLTRAIGLGEIFEDKKIISSAYECNNSTGNILAAIFPTERRDWITTLITYDIKLSNIRDTRIKCYGFWVSYIDQNGNILTSNCLKAQPKWMNDIKHIIGDLTMKDIFIPGTHNSGSFRPDFNPVTGMNIFTRYALTQDENIWEQLMHGIRYFDIRVGHYHWKPDKFYINHDMSRQGPLEKVLEDVLNFVKLTNEIIILDFQEFPVGFDMNITVHNELISFVTNYLDGYLVLPNRDSWNLRLNQIWDRSQNIFISYDYQPAVSKHRNILHYACHQRWPRAKNFDQLKTFLTKNNKFYYDHFREVPTVDMAELTADLLGILAGQFVSLRTMADSVNSKVTRLYEDELGEKANIVAVDFYRGTRIVDLAIKLNRKRG